MLRVVRDAVGVRVIKALSNRTMSVRGLRR